MNKFDKVINEAISKPQFNRMDGLVNVRDLKTFKNMTKALYKGLKDQGFDDSESGVILDYLTQVVKQTLQEME